MSNDVEEELWKEVVVVWCEELSRLGLGGSEAGDENPPTGWMVSVPRFELDTYPVQSKRYGVVL